jgi:hypothetical protein
LDVGRVVALIVLAVILLAHPQAPIWNDILIHGGSERDWTLGCLTLDNADLLELFDLLHHSHGRGLGVPVTMVP